MRSEPLPPHAPLHRYYRGEEGGDARRAFVTGLFDETAPHYNGLNRILSFGSGLRYRQQALERAGLRRGMRMADIAVGTGLTARAALNATAGSLTVIGIDASLGMLREARAAGLPIALVRGFAEQLPLATGRFDFLTMGYALRHVADLRYTFCEYLRVLKPGGRFLILELTRPSGAGVRYALMRVYLKHVVPFVAQLGPGGPGTRRLMEYYWDTIDRCVPPETVLSALRDAGLKDVEHRVFLDVFSEYVGRT